MANDDLERSRSPQGFGGINNRVSVTARMVVSRLASRVGMMTKLGLALPIATRTPMMDVGMSCSEVAFNTNSIADEYSAFGELSNSFAARIP